MSFGQFVPLLLVALPVFAAGEVYFGRVLTAYSSAKRLISAFQDRHDEIAKPNPNNSATETKEDRKSFFPQKKGFQDVIERLQPAVKKHELFIR